MLAAILLPQTTSQTPMVMATESLGPTRIFIKTADICYGKSNIWIYLFTVFFSSWYLLAVILYTYIETFHLQNFTIRNNNLGNIEVIVYDIF